MTSATDIPSYIASFPKDVQEKLNDLWKVVREAAPKATGKIAYGMPTLVLHGNLLHFAAYKKHIGFYPVPSGIAAFQKELAPYTTSKGTVQFPLDKPLPLALIKRITAFRVKENEEMAEAKMVMASARRKKVAERSTKAKAVKKG